MVAASAGAAILPLREREEERCHPELGPVCEAQLKMYIMHELQLDISATEFAEMWGNLEAVEAGQASDIGKPALFSTRLMSVQAEALAVAQHQPLTNTLR